MDQLPEGLPAPVVRPEQRPPVLLQVRALRSFDAHEEHSRLSARVTLLCHRFHPRYIICVVLFRVRVAQKF